MEDSIVFYHFNTKDAMDSFSMKGSDIAFCKETRSIRTHDTDYGLFEWDEIPSISGYPVNDGLLTVGDNGYVENNTIVFSDPSISISGSTIIIS